jgi:Zc3h12a-like Ribonuclease NYN domain
MKGRPRLVEEGVPIGSTTHNFADAGAADDGGFGTGQQRRHHHHDTAADSAAGTDDHSMSMSDTDDNDCHSYRRQNVPFPATTTAASTQHNGPSHTTSTDYSNDPSHRWHHSNYNNSHSHSNNSGAQLHHDHHQLQHPSSSLSRAVEATSTSSSSGQRLTRNRRHVTHMVIGENSAHYVSHHNQQQQQRNQDEWHDHIAATLSNRNCHAFIPTDDFVHSGVPQHLKQLSPSFDYSQLSLPADGMPQSTEIHDPSQLQFRSTQRHEERPYQTHPIDHDQLSSPHSATHLRGDRSPRNWLDPSNNQLTPSYYRPPTIRTHIEIGGDTRGVTEKMEGVVADPTEALPLMVLDGANVAYAYGQAMSQQPVLHGDGDHAGRVEPDVRGIQVACQYFAPWTRVLVVLPQTWFRGRPDSRLGGSSAPDDEQLRILDSLQSRLVAAPPRDDDDAYALTICQRENARANAPLAYVVSNDMFRDAQERDPGLADWLTMLHGRISFSFADMGCMDDRGDRLLDFVPNPRHPLVVHIEQQNRHRWSQQQTTYK